MKNAKITHPKQKKLFKIVNARDTFVTQKALCQCLTLFKITIKYIYYIQPVTCLRGGERGGMRGGDSETRFFF